MRITVLISLFCLVLLLVATGCSSGQSAQQEPTTSFSSTGTEGISMRFVEGQPPSRIYEGTELNMLVEVRNKGVFDVSNVQLYLSGFDPSLIAFSGQDGGSSQIIPSLLGKSRFNPDGEMTMRSFATSAGVNLLRGMDVYSPKFLLTACYNYQTIATPLVCVDPNPLDTLSEKACRPSNIAAGSQGAPIAVTSIEQETTPSSLYYRIHVANVGKGVVVNKDSIGGCINLQYSDLNKISYVVSMSNPIVSCTPPNGQLTLVNGKGTIFCQFTQSQGQAYETPLDITLSYAYKDTISRTVEIQNLN